MWNKAKLLGLTAAVTALGTLAAAADPCRDLWYSKNAILAQAGYCFETELGKAVFGNDDCTADEVPTDLPEFFQRQLDRIAEREDEFSCAVDTAATELPLARLEVRQQLAIQPVHNGKESLCILKAPTSVWSAPDVEADQIGWLKRGDLITMAHEKIDGVEFASQVRRGGVVLDLVGWFGASQCKSIS